MSTYKFTKYQRFAIFSIHGDKCYLCSTPINLDTMEIDHIIPEKLSKNPKEFQDARIAFDLPEEFDINSFANWSPACKSCNRKKTDRVFKPAPIILDCLLRAGEKASACEEHSRKKVSERDIAKAKYTLKCALDDDETDYKDWQPIFDRLEKRNRKISTPNHLPRKPLVTDIRLMCESNKDFSVPFLKSVAMQPCKLSRPALDDRALERRRVTEIARAWAVEEIALSDPTPIPPCKKSIVSPNNVSLLITARHPQTKVLCKSFIQLVGRRFSQHGHAFNKGELLSLDVNGSDTVFGNLKWHFNVKFDKGEMSTTSILRLTRKLLPRYKYIQSEYEDSYEQVVRKLAESWQPMGFIAMDSTQSIDSRMHPEAFEIELQITEPDLNECLYRYSKIRLARKLEMEWGQQFKFTEVYFQNSLSLAAIQAASDELREQLGVLAHWCRGESPPLASVGRYDIKLMVERGVITFRGVLRVSSY